MIDIVTQNIKVKKLRRASLNLSIDTNFHIGELNPQKPLHASQKFMKKNHPYINLGPKEMLYDVKQKLILQKFEDLYERGKKIGEGAQTTIYQCFEKCSRKKYAVKIWKKCAQDILKDIKHSFLLLKQLEHPLILKVQKLYVQRLTSKCYLISQISQSKNLRQYLQSLDNKKISQKQAANIISQLLQCLKYLKEKGVCHRDIKPQNILYDPKSKQIKLIDFELSKMKKYKGDSFDLWTSTGSLYYRAPQSYIFSYGQSVDMWATGVILYQLLTGNLPFSSNSIKQTIQQIKSKQIIFSGLQISVEAQKIIQKMLDRDIKNRLVPELALKQPFLLKNTQYFQLKLKKQLSEAPVIHYLILDQQKKNQKYFDDNSVQKLLRVPQRDNGIRVIQ